MELKPVLQIPLIQSFKLRARAEVNLDWESTEVKAIWGAVFVCCQSSAYFGHCLSIQPQMVLTSILFVHFYRHIMFLVCITPCIFRS